MKEDYNFPGMALNYLECTICNERVKSCDSCGREFVNDDKILHITHDMLNFHFCSDKCHEDFLKFDVTGVPA